MRFDKNAVRWGRLVVLGLLVVVCFSPKQFGAAPVTVTAAPGLRATALRVPDGYTPESLTLPPPGALPEKAGVYAVAIVGDVESHTSIYKSDMNGAVAALQAHGVNVTKFYYGDSSFNWSDIVTAATGAHFILYMGHGIYSGGDCAHPVSVGGFYLGGGHFVMPDQIRSDLAGRLAADSVVILSHACFSAGNSACDPAGTPSLDEAERRVAMYAAPFVDVGMDAYFANNYFDSAAAYVDRLLAAPAGRQTAGDIFKSVYPFQQSQFYDLTYPTPAYDLWLSGSTGNWSDAFVGIPAYIFAGDTAASPALGGLPDTLSFSYDRLSGVLTPPNATLSPVNAGNDTVLQWQVSPVGNWFGVSPTQGTTGQTLTITPQGFDAGQDGTYTGSVTITVTDPPGVTGSPHTVTLSLDVTSEPTYGLFLPLVVTP